MKTSKKVEHTPTPWRAGDAGSTVFGPPNGNPSPLMVAVHVRKPDAAFIVKAVNYHEELVERLKEALAAIDYHHGVCGEEGCRYCRAHHFGEEAIARAEGKE